MRLACGTAADSWHKGTVSLTIDQPIHPQSSTLGSQCSVTVHVDSLVLQKEECRPLYMWTVWYSKRKSVDNQQNARLRLYKRSLPCSNLMLSGHAAASHSQSGIMLLPAACDRCWCWGCCCRCTCLLCLLGRTWQVWLLLQLLGPDLRPLQHLVGHSPSAHQHLHREHTPYQPKERAPLAAARGL